MHLVFLVEDKSGKELVQQILIKYCDRYPEITYEIHSSKGIGTIPKGKQKVSQPKTYKLLNDLPKYLRGISRRLQEKDAIFVVLDCDNKNCNNFKKSLLDIVEQNQINRKVFFCLAIEEMEAWLLGDLEAIHRTYPKARLSEVRNYIPDSIVGTWELLSDVVYEGGRKKLNKDCPTYYEVGALKIKWAVEIGRNLDIDKNTSPSFQYFIKKLDEVRIA